jgi:flavin reductase (DIM6/NTAB) family NADH-FMN oxidoreductase RutF
MPQVKLNPQAFFPMPLALIGTQLAGKANFMTQAWISRVNYEPPLLAIAVNKGHCTNEGIRLSGEFSICFPGRELERKADYCGLVSGKEVDKGALFDVFYGHLRSAPLINECPLNLACRLVEEMSFATNSLFIGEIIEVFADAQRLDGTRPDFKAMDLFSLTMPDNTYWSMGEAIGSAWSDGKSFSPG